VSSDGLVSRLEMERELVGQDDDVQVRWTVTNQGTATAYLLRWEAPGAELTSDLFDVRVGGQPVAYVGKDVKRRTPTATDLVAIAPGQSLSSTVDLSAYYRVARAGQYQIQYTGDGSASSVGAVEVRSNTVMAIRAADSRYADAEEAEAQLETEALLAPAPQAAGLSYRSCSSSEKTQIASALTQSGNYARNAESYLVAGKTGARYTTWFGTYNSSRYSTVRTHFTNIRSTIETKNITVDCSCTDDYYAYVYPTQPYIVYVCNAFWSAPTTGTDSKAGTLVHELSHFNVVASTDDWTYGQSSCRSLAKSNPAHAIDNADSHEYFAENNPAQN
jgi:peptidyl-Lys metalloendopeptidase